MTDQANQLSDALDIAFAGLPKVRDDSHTDMLGVAAAIVRYVDRQDPEYVIPQERINKLFSVLYPWVRRPEDPFPRYFTAQMGRFHGDRLYLRCDDRNRSVYVLEDGSEEDAGSCCNYGACARMCVNGSWQELTEKEAKELTDGQ
jgi:hypothetical protein